MAAAAAGSLSGKMPPSQPQPQRGVALAGGAQLALLAALMAGVAWQSLTLQRLSEASAACGCSRDGGDGESGAVGGASLARAVEENARALEQIEADLADLGDAVRRLAAAPTATAAGAGGTASGRQSKSGATANPTASTAAGKKGSDEAGQSDGGGTELGTRTIHFMYGLWDSKPMPAEFKSNLEAWKRLNPAWAVKVWGKKEVRDMWKTHYPEHVALWKKARPIQRADLARYMIVLRYGGLYADLDAAPTKSIDDLLHAAGFRHVAHNTVLCVEDEKTDEDMATSARWPIRRGVPEFKTRIANYVFWAKPGSATLKRALDLAAHRLASVPDSAYHVQGAPHLKNPYAIIYTTGPDALTEAAFPSRGAPRVPDAGVLVLPPDKCHMTNLATGTWIGDNNAATDIAS